MSIGIAAMLFAASAGAQTVRIEPGTPNAEGVFITPLDNPVLKTDDIPLPFPQDAKRTNVPSWEFFGYELQMFTSCAPQDPGCVAVPTRSDYSALNVWPAFELGWLRASDSGFALFMRQAAVRAVRNIS
jgi:hypothetical protein